MTAPFFVDTNLLVYADDRADPHKQEIARRLLREALESGAGRLSTQVLLEFFAVATRKLGLSAADARSRVEIYSALPVFRPAVEDLLAAIDLHHSHQLAIWDALVVRSAISTGCSLLYTEDLQDGQVFETVRVTNPFNP